MNYYEEPITPKRSLGALRKNSKTKPKSPDLTGQIKLQRHTIETIAKQFERTESDEVVANLAGWENSDHSGQYLTVELSPRYVSQGPKTPRKSTSSTSYSAVRRITVENASTIYARKIMTQRLDWEKANKQRRAKAATSTASISIIPDAAFWRAWKDDKEEIRMIRKR